MGVTRETGTHHHERIDLVLALYVHQLCLRELAAPGNVLLPHLRPRLRCRPAVVALTHIAHWCAVRAAVECCRRGVGGRKGRVGIDAEGRGGDLVVVDADVVDGVVEALDTHHRGLAPAAALVVPRLGAEILLQTIHRLALRAGTVPKLVNRAGTLTVRDTLDHDLRVGRQTLRGAGLRVLEPRRGVECDVEAQCLIAVLRQRELAQARGTDEVLSSCQPQPRPHSRTYNGRCGQQGAHRVEWCHRGHFGLKRRVLLSELS